MLLNCSSSIGAPFNRGWKEKSKLFRRRSFCTENEILFGNFTSKQVVLSDVSKQFIFPRRHNRANNKTHAIVPVLKYANSENKIRNMIRCVINYSLYLVRNFRVNLQFHMSNHISYCAKKASRLENVTNSGVVALKNAAENIQVVCTFRNLKLSAKSMLN